MGLSSSYVEILYRAIKRSCPPEYVTFNLNGEPEISSALFKDENGVSVSKQMQRTEEDVISHLKNKLSTNAGRTRLKGAVKLSENDVIKAGAIVVDTPDSSDRFHAEIHKNSNEKLLSNLQMLQLADCCQLCYWNNHMESTCNN